MMKRIILLSVLWLLPAFGLLAQTIDFTSVTVSTERVKKVKQYERCTFVLATPSIEISEKGGTTESHIVGTSAHPVLGARFGQVKKWGYYIGFQVGLGGLPFKSSDESFYEYWWSGSKKDEFRGFRKGTGDNVQAVELAGGSRYARLGLDFGVVVRLSKVFNLYLGPSMMLGQDVYKVQSGVPGALLGGSSEVQTEWLAFRGGKYAGSVSHFCLGPEVGMYLFFKRFTLMAGAARLFDLSGPDASKRNATLIKLGAGVNF